MKYSKSLSFPYLLKAVQPDNDQVFANKKKSLVIKRNRAARTFNDEFSGALGGASDVTGCALVGPAVLGESFGDLQRNTFVLERDLEICISRNVVSALEPFDAWFRFT